MLEGSQLYCSSLPSAGLRHTLSQQHLGMLTGTGREESQVSLANQPHLCCCSILRYFYSSLSNVKLKDYGGLGNLFISTGRAEKAVSVFLGASVFTKLSIWALQSQWGSPPSFIKRAQHSDLSVWPDSKDKIGHTWSPASYLFIQQILIECLSHSQALQTGFGRKTTVILSSTPCHICPWYTIQTMCMREDMFFF